MPLSALDQPLVRRARELASVAHAKQRRKAGGVPYVVHLEGVATLLAEHGHDDETTLATAYLHDLLEDQPEHAERLRAEMPASVVETVEALTERKHDESGQPLEKRERFRHYLSNLARGTDAARRAIPVSCANKIDNLRSLASGPEGLRLLFRMSTRPGDQEPQLRALRRLYAPVVSEALLGAFDDASEALFELVEAGLPDRAVALAAEAHFGQRDKAGAPYIHHPLRLMLRAVTADEKLVAVLHDVLEDSSFTAQALRREGFSRRVVRAIERLTRKAGESYEDFVERVAGDGLATRVKILDLEDNSDLARMSAPGPEDEARVQKYQRAIERLRPELEFRSLSIELDRASRRRTRRLAVHPELYGDHVTLAFRVNPASYSPTWVPGEAGVGDRIEFSTVGQVKNERVHALIVEIAGTRRRPFDGGPLHVTLSTTSEGRPFESNALIASGAEIEALSLSLSGTVEWVVAP